jgi:hypothetical protein
MSGEGRLDELERMLAELGERPVAAHPDALEAVHRAVVAELDDLSGVGAAERPTGE